MTAWASGGLWMLLVLALLMVGTGLPVWALLIGVASAAAGVGLAAGLFDAPVLASVVPRLLNLLEHDLLQAMPLYVFVGLLLQRVALADAVFACAARVLRGTGAAPSLAALATGALLAPMNGSVASSSVLLSRIAVPRLEGLAPPRAIALVSAAACIGVVVPPSLVLILLGDAMLRAHTEASNLPGYTLGTQRIVNTADVLHAALVPALLVLALWAAVAWVQGRGARAAASPHAPLGRRTWLAAGATVATILALLTGVFLGWLLAVEAAATGGCLLVAYVVATRALDGPAWREVLLDALAFSGALFALLVGATTFSLVFRLFGTDRWLTDLVLGSPWPPQATSLLVLAGVAACAMVLDAFEMVFVVVPILAPLLVVRLGDAQQVAVLFLLVLQLGFLVPPIGYAILMARARSGLPDVGTRTLLRGVLPFLACQVAVLALVGTVPAVVHGLDAPPPPPGATPAPRSDEDIERLLREMNQPADGDAPAK